jgi:Ras-related C3 botulinum toxin substrate 1
LISFATGEFPVEYVPTVFENYSAKMKINDKIVFLHLWDTAGQEDYDRLRPLSYPDSDIVLLCFSTTSKNSYDSVLEKWHPEIKHYLPNTPVILVGTKVDLRDSRQEDPNAEKTEYVTKEEVFSFLFLYSFLSFLQGEQLGQDIGAVQYMEVSAKAACDTGGGGLQQIFLECVKTVMSSELESDDDQDDGHGSSNKVSKPPPKRKGGCALL